MAKTIPELTPELARWIERQPLFFVATAPLSAEGHVNLSPKGLDSFRILDPLTVAYLDYTGSGAETLAHLGENGRMTIMFCAFEGPPRILRLYGRGRATQVGTAAFDEDIARLAIPPGPGARAVMTLTHSRTPRRHGTAHVNSCVHESAPLLCRCVSRSPCALER